MPLIQGPTSGGLLLGPGGNLAGDLNCCCECTLNQTCVDYPCVLRITAQRSIVTFSRNTDGFLIGVSGAPTTDQISDVTVETCP